MYNPFLSGPGQNRCRSEGPGIFRLLRRNHRSGRIAPTATGTRLFSQATGDRLHSLNILNPRPGTPLERSEPVPPLEIIKTIALFRLILPKGTIKIAGGREANLRDLQSLALLAGPMV